MKPCIRLLLVFVCIVSIHICNAQTISLDSIKTKYENKTIHYSNGHYVKSYQTLTHDDFKNEFTVSPEASVLFQSYQKNKTTSLIFIGAVATHDNNKSLSGTIGAIARLIGESFPWIAGGIIAWNFLGCMAEN